MCQYSDISIYDFYALSEKNVSLWYHKNIKYACCFAIERRCLW